MLPVETLIPLTVRRIVVPTPPNRQQASPGLELTRRQRGRPHRLILRTTLLNPHPLQEQTHPQLVFRPLFWRSCNRRHIMSLRWMRELDLITLVSRLRTVMPRRPRLKLLGRLRRLLRLRLRTHRLCNNC